MLSAFPFEPVALVATLLPLPVLPPRADCP